MYEAGFFKRPNPRSVSRHHFKMHQRKYGTSPSTTKPRIKDSSWREWRRICSRLRAHAYSSARRGILSGGAKAPTTEWEAVRLQSVVRRLRTTDCKRTPSNSTVGAFAPPKKVHRSEVESAVTNIASPMSMHRRACSRLRAHACSCSCMLYSPRYGVLSGGAKAPTTEWEAVRLQSMVRRLRTTDCKRTPSNSTVGAFAPPTKVHRSGVRCAVIMAPHMLTLTCSRIL